MHAYHELKEMLCNELEELVKKGDLSAGSLDVVDKLTHSIKSLDTIMAMEDAGYSNDGYNGYSGYRGQRRDSMGRYADGGSYGRYYDDGMNRGGYSGRRYSREEGVSMISQEIERLMDDAKTPEEREILKQAHQKLKQMM